MTVTTAGSRLLGVVVLLTLVATTLLSVSPSAKMWSPTVVRRSPNGSNSGGGVPEEGRVVSKAVPVSSLFSARPPGLPDAAPWRPQPDVLLNGSKPSTVADAAARLLLPVGHDATLLAAPSSPLGTAVFAVITDPPLWESRVRPMLQTWLGPATQTAGTVLFFDEAQRANASVLFQDAAVAEVLNASGAVVEFLPEPSAQLRLTSPNGAWKNLAIAAALRERYMMGGGADHQEGRRPEWFVIVDDDTFVLPTNAELHMRAAQTQHRDGHHPVYLGHPVLKCADCRTKSKRFWFVYGGNGIFMNAAAVERVTKPAHLAGCLAKYTVGAGDERLGACFRDAKVRVMPIEGGGEGPLSSLAERPDLFVVPSLFPFAFHRMTRPALTQALWAFVVERTRSDGFFVSWAALARWFLSPSVDACAGSSGAVNASARCWPVIATPAEWFPSTYDPKQRALDQYAKSREQARSRGGSGGMARRSGAGRRTGAP